MVSARSLLTGPGHCAWGVRDELLPADDESMIQANDERRGVDGRTGTRALHFDNYVIGIVDEIKAMGKRTAECRAPGGGGAVAVDTDKGEV